MNLWYNKLMCHFEYENVRKDKHMCLVNNPHEVKFLNAFDEFPIGCSLYKNQNIQSKHHVGDFSPKTYKFHLLYFKNVLYGVCVWVFHENLVV